jgi:hypothetical protein
MSVPLPVKIRRGVWSGGLHLTYWVTSPTDPGRIDRIILVNEEGLLAGVFFPYTVGTVPPPRRL